MCETLFSFYTFLTDKTTLDILGTTLGLLYLWQELKTSAWMWVTGSVMPVIYFFVLYQAGLYADCAMEVYYFLAGIYGLIYWLCGKQKDGKSIEISHTPRRTASLLCSIFIILFIAIRTMLIEFTDSNVPTLDALTTALSVIGLWMLSHKYLEQWMVWIVVDAISSALYIYKGVYARSLLYGIYTVIAVFGYYKWRKMMTENNM